MDSSELAPLEITVAKLTSRSPDKLYVTDTPRRQERLETELERQLAIVGDDDYDDTADYYLEEHVFEADADELVVTNAYPRNAGMASGIYQALKALRLSSGATVYYASGEWERSRVRAVSASNMDDHAAAVFGEVIALPTYFYVGDALLEIDRHLSVCIPGSWLFDQLLEHDAEWMEQEKLDEGEERRAELQRAIDESAEEGDADNDQLEQVQRTLDATPPWFLLLDDSDLEEVARYTLPDPSDTRRLSHGYLPWKKPTPEMFLDPGDATNRQHIVAAYLLAR